MSVQDRQIVSPHATFFLYALVLDCLFFFNGPLPIHSRNSPQPPWVILITRSLAACIKLVCSGGEYLRPQFFHKCEMV